MRGMLVYAALAVAIGPLSAQAQSLPLTESDALARLSLSSPRVRAIRAGVDVAQVDVLVAKRWPNPRVSVNREAVAGTTEYLTTVSQPLPITGRRGLEVAATSARVTALSSRADGEVRRLQADLRMAFANLVAAQVREHELANAVGRLQRLANILAAREAAGDAAGFDRLRAEREVLDVDIDRRAAASERAQAQSLLASFFDDILDPSRLLAVEDSTSPMPVRPLEALLEVAESGRGELVALRHEIEAAAFASRAAARRNMPEPTVVVGTKTSTFGGGDLGSVLMVQLDLPLFDRARPERTLAARRADQARARRDALRRMLRGQIAALRAAVLDRREAAARYRADAVPSADQIERIAQVSYDAGERGILELLDAYRLGASARTRQAALDAAVRHAEIELASASGWEMSQ